MIFVSFCAHGWDIRIDELEDLHKARGSAMGGVIDLLLHNNPIMLQGMQSITGNPVPLAVAHAVAMALSSFHVSMQWLIKQLNVSLRSYARLMLMASTDSQCGTESELHYHYHDSALARYY
jgi:hypothetical protein